MRNRKKYSNIYWDEVLYPSLEKPKRPFWSVLAFLTYAGFLVAVILLLITIFFTQ